MVPPFCDSYRCCLETQLRLSIAADQAVHLLHSILAQLTVLSNTVRSLQHNHESSQRAQLAQQISQRGDLLMGMVLLGAAAKAHRTNVTRQCQRRGSCWLQGLFLGVEMCQWMGLSSAPVPRQWLCQLRRSSLFLLGWTMAGCWAGYTAYHLLQEKHSFRGYTSDCSRTSSSSNNTTTVYTPTMAGEAVLHQPLSQTVSKTLGDSQHSQGMLYQQSWLLCAQSDQPRDAEPTSHLSTAVLNASFPSGISPQLAPTCRASSLEFAAQLLSTALLAHLSLYLPVHFAAVALMGGSWGAWLLLHCVRFSCTHVFANSVHSDTAPLQPLSILKIWSRRCWTSWISIVRQGATEKQAAPGAWQQQQMYGSQAEDKFDPAAGVPAKQSVSAQSGTLLLLQLVLPVAHGILPFALEVLFGYGVKTCFCIAVLLITHLCWQQLHRLMH